MISNINKFGAILVASLIESQSSDKVPASKFPRYKWVNPKIKPVQQPKVNINKLPPDPGTNPQLDPRYRFN